MIWTEAQLAAYLAEHEEKMMLENDDTTEVDEKGRVSNTISDVRCCKYTGYLKKPRRDEVIRHSSYVMLAYKTIPYRKIYRDYLNPVDPRSILCICYNCINRSRPRTEMIKELTAYAEPVPQIPIQISFCNWRPLPPAPRVYWPTQQNADEGFEFRWVMPKDRMYANVESYEVYYYREIPDKVYTTTPWKEFSKTHLRYQRSIKLYHGGFHHFTVRAIDKHYRYGPFSKPVSLFLTMF